MRNTGESTNNFLNEIEIKNFKSIKDLRPDPCKRVNVFVGKPNVGKSTILEGLAPGRRVRTGRISIPEGAIDTVECPEIPVIGFPFNTRRCD